LRHQDAGRSPHRKGNARSSDIDARLAPEVRDMGKQKQKRRPKKPVPAEVFCHAIAYWKGAAALSRECRFKHPFRMPMAVLEVFSIELFLKCLLELRRKPAMRTHELEPLMNALSKRDQTKIIANFDRYVAANPRLSRKVSIRSVMDRSSNYFNAARYVFEGHKWKPDADGWIGNEGFLDLLWAVREHILSIHPEFETTAKAILTSVPAK
jgi:hypothetical protein